MHIGCNHYQELKYKEFKEVEESHNDVKSYAEFFKKELKFHPIIEILDKSKGN